MSNNDSSSSDHASASMSKSSVRLALEASVAWTPAAAPPVRFQRIHESTVPNASDAVRSTPPSVSSHSSLWPRVRIEHEPGARADERLVSVGAQRLAAAGGATVLPHQGTVERDAGVAVPYHRCLALVRDPDRRDSFAPDRGDDVVQGLRYCRPDLGRVVLDPPGRGKCLRELAMQRTRSPGSSTATVRTPVVPAPSPARRPCPACLPPRAAGRARPVARSRNETRRRDDVHHHDDEHLYMVRRAHLPGGLIWSISGEYRLDLVVLAGAALEHEHPATGGGSRWGAGR